MAKGLIGAALLMALAGCGNRGDKLHDVSGTVTFNGQPVPAGQIYFDPDPAKGGAGQQGVANIKDGHFDTAAGGRGVAGGAYVVRVSGFDGRSANEYPQGKPLFNQYEFNKELPQQKSQLDIDVPK